MKTLKMAAMAAACVAMMSSCSEDRYEDPRPAAEEGDIVHFGLDLGAQSRTMYGPETEVNGVTVQQIFWGNYKEGKTESIRVFCNESPAGRNVATYNVNLNQTENSSIAASINCTSGQPIQWGGQETGYTFYAIYPADRAAEVLNGSILRVTVNNGQTPVSYGEGGTNVNNNLVLSPTTNHNANPVTIYGNPDMSNALMYAKTETDRTSDAVGLHFNVLTDVLEVTVNGPVQGNTLKNGTEQADYIEIRAVNIESKSGKPLGGEFNVDLSTGKYSGNPVYPVRTLHMNTALLDENNNVVYPKLYWRGTNGYDKLKLRFFLWPGVQASDLRVVVDTDCGQFTWDDVKGPFEDGKIHKLSLPHFVTPGQKFDLSKWMEILDPNIYISELSIPGAWHAASAVYQTYADFDKMYDAGVRAYEVPVWNMNGALRVEESNNGRTLIDVINKVGSRMTGKTGFVYFCVGDQQSSADFPGAMAEVVDACSQYIYPDEVGANTTLGQVVGKIILKINTNGPDNGVGANETGWRANFPALFSRWTAASVGNAREINMQWGAPIAPKPEAPTHGPLVWCYTEQGRIGSTGTPSEDEAIQNGKNAIDRLLEISLNAFKSEGTDHNTFYLCGIGGCYIQNWGNEQRSNAVTFAASLNPYLLQKLVDPNREPSPTGIVLMNLCNGSESDPQAYSSAELIKAIVYNNNSFIMKRKEANN